MGSFSLAMSFINESNAANAKNLNFTYTSDSGGREVTEEAFIWFWPVLLVVTFLGFVGNVAVLWIVATVEQFRKPANYLLANLSLTSLVLLTAILSISVQKHVPLLSYGPWICRLLPIHGSPIVAEGLTMMQLSLDRTRVIRRPLKRETKVIALKKIAAIWGIAIGITLLSGILFYDYDGSKKDLLKCSDRDQSSWGSPMPYVIFMIINFVLVFLLPAIVMLRDVLLLTCQLRFLVTCPATAQNATGYHIRRQELMRNAIIFTLLFIVFTVPAGVYITVYRVPQEVMPKRIRDCLREWRRFFYGLMVLRGSFFPIIIFGLSTDIRHSICLHFCPSQEANGPRAIVS